MLRVAAVDCGTNSIRLLVADMPRGPAAQLAPVVRRMEIVRLGQDVDRTGRLAPAALERTRAALAGYAAVIASLGAQRVRMVATSAVRDAANADEFRAMVTRTLGVQPEVISGEEEARLTFVGAVRGVPAVLPPPYLVVDIGGGSTEFVLGHAARGRLTVDRAVSVDIGCVRMTERHFTTDPPTGEQVRAAAAEIGGAVEGALAVIPGYGAASLVGLAGSVTTVTAIALGLRSYDPSLVHHARVGYPDVAKITDQLLAMSHAERLALPVMHPGRADVIAAGALVLRVVMERVGADAITASEHDILDGICYSLR